MSCRAKENGGWDFIKYGNGDGLRVTRETLVFFLVGFFFNHEDMLIPLQPLFPILSSDTPSPFFINTLRSLHFA